MSIDFRYDFIATTVKDSEKVELFISGRALKV